MIKLKPNSNNVILKEVKNDEKIGSILIASSATEKSTQYEVMILPKYCYHPNGDLKDCQFKQGEKVRIPTGNVGTGVPEAPQGENWLCIAEDLIYYAIEEV